MSAAATDVAAARPRVLVVEDEMVVAMLVEDMLGDLGCVVAVLSTHLDEAIEFAGRGVYDFAILDVNLNGRHSFPVADVLAARGIPFAFATGYAASALSPPYDRALVLHKPFQIDELERLLRQAGIAVSG